MAIKDNTNAVLSKADELITEKLRLSALLVERTAKEKGYCPVLTGTARRSILSNWYGAAGTRRISWPNAIVMAKGKKVHIKAGKTSIPSQSIKRAIIGSNIEYFPYIEMGTRKMPAHAPLRRSLETNWGKIKRIFGAR